MSELTLTGHPVPQITATDRLGLTLFFAVTIHVIIILGITFGSELLNQKDPVQTMEITLVQSRSETEPDKDAQFLAQATQQGSGSPDNVKRSQAARKEAIKTTHQTQGTAPENSIPIEQQKKRIEQRQREVMTADNAKSKISSQKQTPKENNKKRNVSNLMSRALQIASNSAEIEYRNLANKNKLKKKFITASTKEFKYAAYQEAWRQKVERIGRINYPEEARKRKLSGNLTLTVVLRSNGTVKEIEIVNSSGNRLLDDAARRIVRLAAPYAPFPENIRAETDLLYITRTWIFQRGNTFNTK